MKTIIKFSVELEELVGRKWQMAPNRMFQQLTDKTTKKKHRPFYEAVDAHARRRLKKKHRPFYEAVDAHARCCLKESTFHFMKRRRLMKGTKRLMYWSLVKSKIWTRINAL